MKGNQYNWTGRGRPIRFETISLRREGDGIGDRTSLVVDSELPDGFEHDYRPFSTVSDFLIVTIIQPQDMRSFQEAQAVIACLCRKLARFAFGSIRRCFDAVSGQSFYPRWLTNLIGFTVVCSVILLVALFMMLLCPCLMCWRISCKPVVQAGKLDTYSDVAWATITVLCGLAMLLALFGVIAVGWAGVGLGHYLYDGRTAQIHASYELIWVIVTHAAEQARENSLQKELELKVRFWFTAK